MMWIKKRTPAYPLWTFSALFLLIASTSQAIPRGAYESENTPFSAQSAPYVGGDIAYANIPTEGTNGTSFAALTHPVWSNASGGIALGVSAGDYFNYTTGVDLSFWTFPSAMVSSATAGAKFSFTAFTLGLIARFPITNSLAATGEMGFDVIHQVTTPTGAIVLPFTQQIQSTGSMFAVGLQYAVNDSILLNLQYQYLQGIAQWAALYTSPFPSITVPNINMLSLNFNYLIGVTQPTVYLLNDVPVRNLLLYTDFMVGYGSVESTYNFGRDTVFHEWSTNFQSGWYYTFDLGYMFPCGFGPEIGALIFPHVTARTILNDKPVSFDSNGQYIAATAYYRIIEKVYLQGKVGVAREQQTINTVDPIPFEKNVTTVLPVFAINVILPFLPHFHGNVQYMYIPGVARNVNAPGLSTVLPKRLILSAGLGFNFFS